jgi:hypothetical protein
MDYNCDKEPLTETIYDLVNNRVYTVTVDLDNVIKITQDGGNNLKLYMKPFIIKEDNSHSDQLLISFNKNNVDRLLNIDLEDNKITDFQYVIENDYGRFEFSAATKEDGKTEIFNGKIINDDAKITSWTTVDTDIKDVVKHIAEIELQQAFDIVFDDLPESKELIKWYIDFDNNLSSSSLVQDYIKPVLNAKTKVKGYR